MKMVNLFKTMRFLVFLPLLFSMAFVKPNKSKKETINGIQWSETTHNFGDVPLGPDVQAIFVFKNKQKNPVKLKSVEPGCSCTVSSFTSEEVKKKRNGEITATFKTKDRPGYFKKFIKVTFDDGKTQELIIIGNVMVP